MLRKGADNEIHLYVVPATNPLTRTPDAAFGLREFASLIHSCTC